MEIEFGGCDQVLKRTCDGGYFKQNTKLFQGEIDSLFCGNSNLENGTITGGRSHRHSYIQQKGGSLWKSLKNSGCLFLIPDESITRVVRNIPFDIREII